MTDHPEASQHLALHHKDTHEVVFVSPDEIEDIECYLTQDDGPYVLVKTKSPDKPNVPIREDVPGLMNTLARVAPALLAALAVRIIDRLWQR